MVPVDLSSQAAIRSAAKILLDDLPRIDVLINNAGVLKRSPELSTDGIEFTYAVNVIAPFLLSNLLLPLLKASPSARIVNLSSELYKSGKVELLDGLPEGKYSGNQLYSNSKLLLVMNSNTLAAQLSDTTITVNSLHPGVIGTDVFREYPAWIGKALNLFIPKPAAGAKPSIYLATSLNVENRSGRYFNKTKETAVVDLAKSETAAKEVWTYCQGLVSPSE